MRKLLIVGASRGVGAAIYSLAPPEFEVLTISRSGLNEHTTKHFQCDVLKDGLPSIDDPLAGFVYCPGSINLKPFSGLNCEDFRGDLELNLIGAVRCLRHYQSNLQASDSAAVVLFSSVAVQTGLTYHSIVSSSKGAVEGLTRALAAEWAPTIRVNAIAPSITDTDLAQRLLRDSKKRNAAADRHALKRVGNPEDIAQMAVFLLSDKAAWITGQVIHVDGGMSAIK